MVSADYETKFLQDQAAKRRKELETVGDKIKQRPAIIQNTGKGPAAKGGRTRRRRHHRRRR